MNYSLAYLDRVQETLEAIRGREIEKIETAAQFCADSVIRGGLLHFFGSGHSMIPTLEAYIRAGSLTNARPVTLERIVERFERVEGVGRTLMSAFDGRPGELMMVFSNSGVNPLPLEVAMAAKERGLFVVGVTSFDHSSRVIARHSCGKKLPDVVDLAIDTHAPYGDACLDFPEVGARISPLSTVANVTIVNAFIAAVVQQVVLKGGTPPIRISRNTPAGEENNRKFRVSYGDRIPELNY